VPWSLDLEDRSDGHALVAVLLRHGLRFLGPHSAPSTHFSLRSSLMMVLTWRSSMLSSREMRWVLGVPIFQPFFLSLVTASLLTFLMLAGVLTVRGLPAPERFLEGLEGWKDPIPPRSSPMPPCTHYGGCISCSVSACPTSHHP